MKKFDIVEFTTSKFLGVTPKNFKPIYAPMFISMILIVIGVVLFLVTSNTLVFKIIFGLSGVVFAMSGIGQIKLKEVPGFPWLHGGCAVAFGILFLSFFLFLGIGFIFLE